MKLGNLLPNGFDYRGDHNIEITGLTLNTQQLQPGDAFIALKGGQHDGRTYIEDAIAKGASAIFCEAHGLVAFNLPATNVPIIPISELPLELENFAQKFYGDPSASVPVIGVTGTNGKTTICYLLAQALSTCGTPSAILGTIGYGFVDDLEYCPLTTPDVLTLQKYLHQLKAKGAQTIAMEVSSHGLSQNRANSVHFESAIFTNLTQDHLDYHLTMQAYGQAKQKLFQFPELRQAIINADCPYGQTIADSVPKRVPVILYSAKEQVRELTLDRNGICAHIKTGWGNGTLRSPLLGEFNVSNLLAVLTQLCARDIPFAQALEALALAQAAPGRMQAIKAAHSPQVIIDYAHTPDALEKALIGARAHAMGRVWCVFGCGGDRDKSKRAAMGAAAMAYADHIIITNDNPRTEDPQQIIQHILDGVNIAQQAKVIVEPDRAKAIELAVTTADVNDTVLVAGKGHEDYQIIGEQKFPFSDQQTVNTILRGEAA